MTVQELIKQCDFYELVSSATKLTKVRNNEYKGLSPFSNEKTPSFFINDDTKTWYCFSTGKGGGLLDYVMEYEGLDKPEAVKFVAQVSGVTLDEQTSSSIFQEAQNYFRRFVDRGYDYLQKRSITPEVADKYNLGYCTGNDLIPYLKNKGFSDEDISSAGLTNDKGNIKFYNRTTLPIKDQYGNIVSFTGRSIDQAMPKYLHGPSTRYFNKKKIVWNLDKVRRQILDQDRVIVCEGQLDAISITEAGYPAVSLLGTNISEHQIKLLANLTKNIYFIYDSDKAGREALQKSFTIIGNLQLDVISHAIILPGGHDPDSFIRKFGTEEFANYIEKAQPDTSAIIQNLIEKYRTNNKRITKTGLTQKIIEDVYPYVEEQFTYRSLDLIERLSQELGLNKKGLHDWFAKKERVTRSYHVYEKINDLQFPAPIYERRLFYHLLNNPSLWYLVREEGFSSGDFSSYLVAKSLGFIHQELDTVEFFDILKERLKEDEYDLVLSFFSLGIDGDFETALSVFKLKNKEKTLRSPAVDFLGRPKTREEKEMTDAMKDKLYNETEPF